MDSGGVYVYFILFQLYVSVLVVCVVYIQMHQNNMRYITE